MTKDRLLIIETECQIPGGRSMRCSAFSRNSRVVLERIRNGKPETVTCARDVKSVADAKIAIAQWCNISFKSVKEVR